MADPELLPTVDVNVQRKVAGGPGVKNTLDFVRVPVVFVPGIAGSRLEDPRWDPDSKTNMLSWVLGRHEANRHALSVDEHPDAKLMSTFDGSAEDAIRSGAAGIPKLPQEPDDPVERYAKRRWCEPAWTYYAPILLGLERTLCVPGPGSPPTARSHPVYAYGYDWRKDNADSAAGLVKYVSDTVLKASSPPAKKVILITHSMGGLVVRYACAKLGLKEQAVGVIHCALPSNGAICAYRRFFTGCRNDMDNLGPSSIETMCTNALFGNAWWKYAALLAGLPSAVELMPTHLYQKNTPPEFAARIGAWLRDKHPIDLDDIYTTYAKEALPGVVRDAPPAPPPGGDDGPHQSALEDVRAIWEQKIRPGLRKNLGTAKAFHEGLGNGQHPYTFVLFSDGLQTDEHIDFSADDPAERYKQGPSGDGTVPGASGACYGLDARWRMGFDANRSSLGHSDVFKDPDFMSAVVAAVRKLMIER